MKQAYYIVLVLSQILLASCATWDDSAHYNPELIQLKQEKAAQQSSQMASASTITVSKNIEFPQQSKHFFTMEGVIHSQADKSLGEIAAWDDSSVVLPHPINADGSNLQVEEENDEQMVSVENMELNHFIHLIFGTYLKVNYMVDPHVEKRNDPVTIHMQEPVPNSAFRKLIRELLKKYSIAVKVREGVAFLEPLKKRVEVEEDYLTFTGHSIPKTIADDEHVLILVPFLYVDPNHYVGIFNAIHPQDRSGSRIVMPGKSMLLKGQAGEVRKLLTLIRSIDKAYLQDQQVRLLPLDYIVAEDLVKRLEELLPPFGVPVHTDKFANGIRLLPMPEIGSLFLISPKKEWLQEALRLIDQLDGPMALGPEPRIFIYRPQNRKASILAEIIMGLRSGGGSTDKSPLQEQAFVGGDEKAKNAKPVPPMLVKTGGAALKEGKLVITVDEGRNALVVFTTPVVYQELEKVLKDLDTLARQVLIEVTIAEVTLTDSLQYGVEWFLESSGSKGIGTLSTLGNLGIGGGGILAAFTNTAGDFQAIFNAFAEDDLINILANPRLVVLDNESASFSVGTDVPVVTSEATASDLTTSADSPSVLRNIQYRKTGINVDVTPTIYSNGTLRLEISQNLSEAQKNDVSPETGSPLILDRTSSTTVILKSGEAILLAGLISETKSDGNQRVPLLGDLPFIGHLFKTTSEQTTKTELMMQVRPVILDTPEDMRIQTLEYEKVVKDLLRLNKFFK